MIAYLFRQAARALSGVGEEFTERKTAIRFFGGHRVQPGPRNAGSRKKREEFVRAPNLCILHKKR